MLQCEGGRQKWLNRFWFPVGFDFCKREHSQMMNSAYETTAVIFLDVLGTKDRNNFDEKFAVHRVFHEEVKNNEERQAASPHVIYTRALRSFSDCTFILYTYKDGIANERKDDLNLLYIALYNTSLSIIRVLNAGFLVRGGAALGEAFMDELGFFGPAIEDAYKLESDKDKAIYPRVILANEIGERLFGWERSRDDGTASMLFSTTPRLILKDSDGRYFLNVFYQLEMSESVQFAEKECTLDSVRTAVDEAITGIEERHGSNESIMRKMAWMRGFTSQASLKTKQGVSPIQTFVLGAK
jgi:hypothetical protein